MNVNMMTQDTNSSIESEGSRGKRKNRGHKTIRSSFDVFKYQTQASPSVLNN